VDQVAFKRGLRVYGIFLSIVGFIEQQSSGIHDLSPVPAAVSSNQGHGIVFKQVF
jgi:hypothetical protein